MYAPTKVHYRKKHVSVTLSTPRFPKIMQRATILTWRNHIPQTLQADSCQGRTAGAKCPLKWVSAFVSPHARNFWQIFLPLCIFPAWSPCRNPQAGSRQACMACTSASAALPGSIKKPAQNKSQTDCYSAEGIGALLRRMNALCARTHNLWMLYASLSLILFFTNHWHPSSSQADVAAAGMWLEV